MEFSKKIPNQLKFSVTWPIKPNDLLGQMAFSAELTVRWYGASDQMTFSAKPLWPNIIRLDAFRLNVLYGQVTFGQMSYHPITLGCTAGRLASSQVPGIYSDLLSSQYATTPHMAH